ncbi:MAG: response regulator [Betaproteobacteria bacterium]|nr:MAG: response regulator [Betaproteobacteria bacterium]
MKELALAVRILVIDDDAIVLEGFRKTLDNDAEASARALDALGASLFGTEAPARAERPSFEVDLVRDGAQGCQRAAEAANAGRPYAVAFVDMRMPGGWDGLQTIEALWRTDPHIQVVICTACSDYSWDDMIARLGRSDRLLILRKPFETIEVFQLPRAAGATR